MLPAPVGCNWQSTGEDNPLQLILEPDTVVQGSRIVTSALKVGRDVVECGWCLECLKGVHRLLLACFHLVLSSRQ